MASVIRKKLDAISKDIDAMLENLREENEPTIEGERNNQVIDVKEIAQSSPAEFKKVEDLGIQDRSRGKKKIVEDNIRAIAAAKKQKVDDERDAHKNTTVMELTKLIQGEHSKDQKGILENDPSEQKQQKYVQIDPDNPSEVHAYLTQLYADTNLDNGPIRPRANEDIPMKEWMEKCYPHIFKVFPQNPRVVSTGSVGGWKLDLLFFHYSLFLSEMKSIFLMVDSHVIPEYVKSSLKVIRSLEKQGFDCRFMRSEMQVVGDKVKRQHDLIVAEKLQIEASIKQIESTLGDATTNKKPCETSKKMEAKNLTEKETYNMARSKIAGMYIACQSKILARKEEQLRRLAEVVQTINELQQGNAASGGLLRD